MSKVIERGARHVTVDAATRQIVFHAKALVIGLITAGESDRDSIRWGNTATWFYEWLSPLLSQDRYRAAVDAAKTDPDTIFPAYDDKFTVTLSQEVSALIPGAAQVSLALSGRRDFEARHLFVAMIDSGLLESETLDIFGLDISGKLDGLKHDLIERMLTHPDTGETLEKWLTAFSLPPEAVARFSPEARLAGHGTQDLPISVGDRKPTPIDELLTRLEISNVDSRARDILDAAATINQDNLQQGEISSTRLFLACLSVGALGSEQLPIDGLSALDLLARDIRFAAIDRVKLSYPTAATAAPVSFDTTDNVAALLTVAWTSATRWFGRPQQLTADALLVALLLQPGTRLVERLAKEGLQIETIREAVVATVRTWMPKWQQWAAALNVAPSTAERFDPPVHPHVAPVSFANLGNDSPDKASLDDHLGAVQEARAFARIAAARGVTPPLAFGIFGEWGSGKSFFMRLMQDHVDKIARKTAAEARHGSAFHGNIVQIRFNAWHYADSNLWASLVDNIFSELDRWSRVNEFKTDDNTLLDKLVTARELSLEAASRLVTQRQHQKAAAERLVAAQQELALSQEAVSVSPRAFWEVVKKQFTTTVPQRDLDSAAEALGLTNLANDIQDLQETLVSARSDAGRARVLSQGLARRLTSSVSILLLFVAIVGGPILFAFLYDQAITSPRFSWITDYVNRGAAYVAGLISATTVVVKGIQRHVRYGLDKLEGYRAQLESVIDEQLKVPTNNAKAAEDKLAQLTSQVAEAQAALAASSDQLARAERDYEADSGRERLLRFVRDRAGSDGYGKHLGLVASIRKDFTQLSMLMSQVDPVLTRDADRQSEDYVRRVKALLDTTGPDLLKDDERARLAQLIATSDPRQTKGFDRIILYIDDLDRCPPEQVVNVLQAVQLLLSFPLFVVVVAVDSRWVIRSLEDHYAKLLEAEGRDGDAATASDYLEKIFQIPYWVRPMTPISSVALLSSMTTGAISPGSLTEAPMTPVVHDGDPQPNAPEPERAVAVSPVGSTHAAVQRNADTVDNGLPDVPGDTTNLVSGARALVLTEHERAYMLNIAPWVGSTPRRALRFLNIYRIIKASLDPANLQRLESGGYRALLTEIALVVGSRRNEGLGIVQALAKGSSIDSLRHGSTDLVLSAMAKGVLNAFADSPEPADLDNLAFYWEMASRYSFGNERPLRTIPQAPATNGEAVQNSGRQE
ncbi:hypothetical protein ELH28_33190 (plasmid) [Rhizobium ruizarguesonis]|nr:hypothetical protein ELH28_33190 [Rhizobium ruizarguesonis]